MSCTVDVTFSPTSAIAYSEVLSITTDASSSPDSVTLTGTGMPTAAVASVDARPIPSMTVWGLGLMSLLLGVLGIRRRMK